MMKKTIFAAIIVLIYSAQAMAQNIDDPKKENPFHKSQNSFSSLLNDYTFSMTTATYSELSGGTSVNNGQIWDDPEYAIPIGFSFQLYNLTIDSLYSYDGVGFFLTDYVDSVTDANYAIAAFEADLLDRGDITGTSVSPISYKLEGSAPNRIFKLEYKNAGFYLEVDSLGTTNDYVNIQLWLYESSNIIEFHYGSSQVQYPFLEYDGETGAFIGLADYNLTNSYLLGGSVANPSLHNGMIAVTGTPASGTVYRFTKNGIGFNENNPKQNIAIFPNPAKNKTTVNLQKTSTGTACLISIEGKIIQTYDIKSQKQIDLDLSGITDGLYMIRFVSVTNEIYYKKLNVVN